MSVKQDIQDYLDAGHSRVIRDEIINYVGKSAAKMKTLMSFFFHDEWRYNQRAAWPVLHISLKEPQLIKPYLAKLVSNLDKPKHDAVVRNTIRIFEDIHIPESVEGPLMDKCFAYLIDRKQAIAIRCFSMTVLGKIVDKYPELAFELKDILENELTYDASAGFKSRAKRTLKAISKLKPQHD